MALKPTQHELQVAAALQATHAIYQAICAAGAGGAPSGHLYAAVMGSMTLQAYESCIAALERAGLVAQNGHLLTARVAPTEKSK